MINELAKKEMELSSVRKPKTQAFGKSDLTNVEGENHDARADG